MNAINIISGCLIPDRTIKEIFVRFSARESNPKGELEFHNSFTLLIAVVLSAQATDKSVNKVTRVLFQKADTPEKILFLGYDGLLEIIKSIGLYRNKARAIVSLSDILINCYGGEVPSSRNDLESLPGVGRKTASVVLNTWFGEPCIAVDTHVFRVSRRLGLADGKNVEETGEILEQVVPDKYKVSAHHWFILHGRYVCKARRPLCSQCFLSDLCQKNSKTHIDSDFLENTNQKSHKGA